MIQYNHEHKKEIGQKLLYSLVILFFSFVIFGLLIYFYRHEMKLAAQWSYENFGLWGMSALVFIGDFAVSPIPPDLILAVVAKSELSDHWFWIVLAMSFVSIFAGHMAWVTSKRFGRSRTAIRIFGHKLRNSKRYVRRFGFAGVLIGALTPFPFSITCWAAGIIEMNWRTFAIATLFRIPRFFIYYGAIAGASSLFDF